MDIIMGICLESVCEVTFHINYINYFFRCKHVIAVDIDPQKIDCAQHNASVYGVNDHIDFVVGDFLCIAPHLKVMSFKFFKHFITFSYKPPLVPKSECYI